MDPWGILVVNREGGKETVNWLNDEVLCIFVKGKCRNTYEYPFIVFFFFFLVNELMNGPLQFTPKNNCFAKLGKK